MLLSTPGLVVAWIACLTISLITGFVVDPEHLGIGWVVTMNLATAFALSIGRILG